MAEPRLSDDVSAADLDPEVRRDLRGLQKDTAESVARHLVAAGGLVDEDPQLALEHARFARRRASRIAVVREAAGIAAYHAGEWAEALAELRAARRMGGGPVHVPVMADIERALGRPERAIDLARGPEVADLAPAERIELAIVAAGARRDLGEVDASVVALQLPELDPARRDPWSARLFYAYADNLLAAGRDSDAVQWFVHAADADAEGETDAPARIAGITGDEPEDPDDFDHIAFGEEDVPVGVGAPGGPVGGSAVGEDGDVLPEAPDGSTAAPVEDIAAPRPSGAEDAVPAHEDAVVAGPQDDAAHAPQDVPAGGRTADDDGAVAGTVAGTAAADDVTTGADPVGIDAPEIEAAEADAAEIGATAAGTDAAGISAAGSGTVGITAAGSGTVGITAAGSDAVGINGTGADETGIDGTGSDGTGADGTGSDGTAINETGSDADGSDADAIDPAGSDAAGTAEIASDEIGGSGVDETATGGTAAGGVDGTGAGASGLDGVVDDGAGGDTVGGPSDAEAVPDEVVQEVAARGTVAQDEHGDRAGSTPDAPGGRR